MRNSAGRAATGAPQGGPASVPATPEYAYQYDDIGNQTLLIQTSTGVWSVTYNGENSQTLKLSPQKHSHFRLASGAWKC